MLWNLVPMNIVHIFLFLDSWVSFLLVIYHIYLWKVSIFLTVNNKCNKYCRVGWWQNIYPPHKQEPKTTTMNWICHVAELNSVGERMVHYIFTPTQSSHIYWSSCYDSFQRDFSSMNYGPGVIFQQSLLIHSPHWAFCFQTVLCTIYIKMFLHLYSVP